MILWFACPQCDNRVGVQLATEDSDLPISVWCATRHPRAVSMKLEVEVEPQTPVGPAPTA